MTKDLFILRHALTEDNHPDGDFARELKKKGIRHAQRLGVWLAKNDLVPEKIISSTAVRALTTAKQCANTAGLDISVILEEPHLYNSSPAELQFAISQTNEKYNSLMIVAHNPGVSMLVAQLSNQFVPMSPGTFVHLRMNGTWQEIGRAPVKLIQSVTEKDLPDE